MRPAVGRIITAERLAEGDVLKDVGGSSDRLGVVPEASSGMRAQSGLSGSVKQGGNVSPPHPLPQPLRDPGKYESPEAYTDC